MIFEFLRSRKGYFKDFWNIYEFLLMMLFLSIVGLRIASVIVSQKLDLQPLTSAYVPFQLLATMVAYEQYLYGLLIIIAYLRALKFLKIPPFTGPATQSILDTMQARSFLVFCAFFIFVLISYALGYQIAFGLGIQRISSLGNSFMSLIRTIFGDFDFPSMAASHPAFGPIYFVLYNMFTGLILMNLFIAVISDIYIGLQDQNEQRWERFITKLMIESFSHKAGHISYYRSIILIFSFPVAIIYKKCFKRANRTNPDLENVLIEMKPMGDDGGGIDGDTDEEQPADKTDQLQVDEQDFDISFAEDEVDDIVYEGQGQRSDKSNLELFDEIKEIEEELTENVKVRTDMLAIIKSIQKDMEAVRNDVKVLSDIKALLQNR